MENFIPIKDFPNYLISNKGEVYSIPKQTFISTPPLPHNNKYAVKLWKEGKRYNYNLHTLVGRHFLPEYEQGMFILHKDETLPFPEINYVENLWCGTQSDNRKDCLKKRRNNQTRDRNGRFSAL